MILRGIRDPRCVNGRGTVRCKFARTPDTCVCVCVCFIYGFRLERPRVADRRTFLRGMHVCSVMRRDAAWCGVRPPRGHDATRHRDDTRNARVSWPHLALSTTFYARRLREPRFIRVQLCRVFFHSQRPRATPFQPHSLKNKFGAPFAFEIIVRCSCRNLKEMIVAIISSYSLYGFTIFSTLIRTYNYAKLSAIAPTICD